MDLQCGLLSLYENAGMNVAALKFKKKTYHEILNWWFYKPDML
jgi:hypothetical protein